jgi:hypothetical protein
VAALNDPYRHELRHFQDLFLPSVKLTGKERVGARLRRRHDAPRITDGAASPLGSRETGGAENGQSRKPSRSTFSSNVPTPHPEVLAERPGDSRATARDAADR